MTNTPSIEYHYDGNLFERLFDGPPAYNVKTKWCKFCDETFPLRCTVTDGTESGMTCTVVDPEPLYAHLRSQHPEVPLGLRS